MKREFFYPSADGETKIHGVEWIPEGGVKAVLQISHGMVEYIDRYDGFASWLAEKGWYVTGNDHLGHGKSVTSEEKYGFFMCRMAMPVSSAISIHSGNAPGTDIPASLILCWDTVWLFLLRQ